MPFTNGVPLPHEGRARFSLAPHVVLIDIDAKHVAVEVHKGFLDEIPELFTHRTLTLAAGDLRFYYFLKTPGVMRFINSLDARMS